MIMQFISSTRYQKYSLLSVVFCLMCGTSLRAQNAGQGYETSLSYSWEIKTPASAPQPILLLKNNGAKPIDLRTWSLYFNSIKKPYLLGVDTLNYQISQLNGDLFRLNMTNRLSPLKPGESLTINILVPDIRNFTEVPSGFYLVYHDEPGNGHLLKNTTTLNDATEAKVALASYQKNAQLNAPHPASASMVFPTPARFSKQTGTFQLSKETMIVAPAVFRKEAELLATELADILGVRPAVASEKSSAPAILLVLGKSASEGYTLTSDIKGITITASDAAGIFYGIQSLKTLFPPDVWSGRKKTIVVPAVTIEDAPRFGYRAFMLDVARNFQSKEKVLKVLDLLALYKMNVLRLHLTDDEGWRIEIPGLPELTELGAKRGHSGNPYAMLPPSYGSGPQGTKFGSGYFTRNDYLEILRYATARHISVIPEIESPGHARAAIKSMDARYHNYLEKDQKAEAERYMLRDIADSSVYRSVQGWSDNVINPALPSTYAFIKKVTSELVKMYAEADAPLKTIHMGGDEVPEGVWTASPAVDRVLAKDSSIGSVYGMWKYFYGKVDDILKEQGLYLSGWEEIGLKRAVVNGKKKWVLDKTVSHRGYTTDVWNNIIGTGAEDLAYNLANNGFRVVLSNVTNMYLDMAYNTSFYEHGMNWAGYVNIDKPFYFIPYNYYLTTTENEYGQPVSQEVFENKIRLQDSAKSNIMGLQSALWSETIVRDSLLEYMLLPKLLGVAERSWAKQPDWSNISGSIFKDKRYKQAWNEFTATAGLRELPRLDFYKGGYQYRIPEVGVKVDRGSVSANMQMPGFTIRYTTDGSEPGVNSPVYSYPITEKGTIKLKSFNRQGRSGKVVTVYND